MDARNHGIGFGKIPDGKPYQRYGTGSVIKKSVNEISVTNVIYYKNRCGKMTIVFIT